MNDVIRFLFNPDHEMPNVYVTLILIAICIVVPMLMNRMQQQRAQSKLAGITAPKLSQSSKVKTEKNKKAVSAAKTKASRNTSTVHQKALKQLGSVSSGTQDKSRSRNKT
ncbi:MAG: hypothetical protein HUJ69_01700 [Lachnospiraceae bacterium]|nr:hypothetical protein [Lachnospiraceae bacterium]